jgi:stage IV sporulation protein FB
MRLGVHWLFVVMLLIISAAGYYLEALILVGSLVAHEIAHLSVAWVLGVEVEELALTPFGGMARMDPVLQVDPQAETSVALAGPFQSFFLAGLTLFVTGGDIWDDRLVQFCFEINANLAFFNLIPALPLDGGRAMRGLMAQRWGYRTVTRWMAWSGRLWGVAMVIVALVPLMRDGNLLATPLVGGIFLLLNAGREVEEATFAAYRQLLRKRERMTQRGIVSARQLVAVEGTRLQDLLEQLTVRQYHTVLVVDRQLRPLGVLHEALLIDAFVELGPTVRVEQMLGE